MRKWIVMALAAAALGFAGCGDDEDGGGADCDALRSCILSCDEADDACNSACVADNRDAAMATVELGLCLQGAQCTSVDCIMEQCGDEISACGWSRSDVEGGVLDDELEEDPIGMEADCAEAESCTVACADSEDVNCVLGCTDAASLGAYSAYVVCGSGEGCIDGTTGLVARTCAEENCPAEYAACNF